MRSIIMKIYSSHTIAILILMPGSVLLKLDDKHSCINVNPLELADAPFRTNNPNNQDANNGLITSIWGPPTWDSFHAITFGFPINPTEEQKRDYLAYFTLLGKVLPCIYCRSSYQKFLTDGATKLDINTVQSRETLTKWGLRIHDAVNNKLGVDYGETYEELCYKYESYRASCTKTDKGCLMPLNMKAKSYQKAEIHRAPIIDPKYSLALSQHAKILGMTQYDNFLAYYSGIKRNTKEWGVRDCVARKIIRYMRKNGVSSLDSNGLPSYHEMMLIAMLSSTLEGDKLNEIYRTISKPNVE
jgi:hypothetical protein